MRAAEPALYARMQTFMDVDGSLGLTVTIPCARNKRYGHRCAMTFFNAIPLRGAGGAPF
jgi:hypothetical protein